ncbi:hypothetical protein C7999DRAFT_12374 [Corynascus novoguineensis]|uniref:Methyltransferase domain-containing protein n=1 Tax=Corynascus novoguineensis TaxID=1126955 RepID=A0AAN7CXN0_9PEZI|nr:hypothetical protein C7999DRAFT_12374 [Corynascus novoguineensis]
MEYLSGYAAAKAPYLTYEVEGSPHSRKKKPSRSNSTTSAVTAQRKRSRIPGHARTNSASTSSSSSGGGGRRTEHHAGSYSAGWLQQPSVAADASGARDESANGAVTSSLADCADPTAQHRREQQQQQYHQPAGRRSSTRDRMSSSLKYFQDKQLPATPRLNTASDASARPFGAGSNSEPASARTPASATAATAAHSVSNPGAVVAAVTFPDRRAHHTTMLSYPNDPSRMPGSGGGGGGGGGGGARAESISSVSGATATSNRTMHSTEHVPESAYQNRPFVIRNGRTYLADPTLPYPLPVDLEELHRQSLKTMLLMQLFGRPICSPEFANKPPPRILEVGCGSGFWSMMCYKHFEARGQHKDVSFTGIDIVPLPPNAYSGDSSTDMRLDKSMNWRFVQHDLRKVPLPFPDASFDFVMIKDMALTTPMSMQQALIEEYIRILTPGGTIEIWETDNMLRMLRPHVPDCTTTSGPTECSCADGDSHHSPMMTTTTPTTTTAAASSSSSSIITTATTPTAHNFLSGGDGTISISDNHSDITNASTTKETEIGGAYIMTSNTPLSTPLNNFLVEYNLWASRALEARSLCAMPCTVIGPLLIQEAEVLTNVGSRRLAVPLSEIRWEREGVGGVVTKDGKSYIETKAAVGRRGVSSVGSGSSAGSGALSPAKNGGGSGGNRGLDPAAAALRRTALLTVVQMIQALEPMLRETSGKSQDEWDLWVGKMMNDLVRENGTSWGECLEVGAWWAKKR